MDLRILTLLLLFISASAKYCGSKEKLKACTCKDKIGKIYSPVDTGYLSCEWPIRADKKNHVVLLESVFVDIDFSKNCSNDYLEVFDGPSVTSPSLGRWCTDGISVKSSGREMLVLYRTDGVTTGAPNRFKLTYKATVGESSNLGLILGLSIPFGLVGLILIIFIFIACCCDSGKGTSTGGVRWSGGGYGGGGGGGGCGGGGGGCGGGGGGC